VSSEAPGKLVGGAGSSTASDAARRCRGRNAHPAMRMEITAVERATPQSRLARSSVREVADSCYIAEEDLRR
jgi:hypothetical protein